MLSVTAFCRLKSPLDACDKLVPGGALAAESAGEEGQAEAPGEQQCHGPGCCVAGVAGTLASAVITQGLAMRSRSRELNAQDDQRREDREQALQNAERADVKTAIASYLEAAQHLQTHLYAREHGREFEDVALMVEQIWLAHAQVDILCSERLRLPLVRHAQALNEVARHEERHEDWWDYVLPYKAALMDAIREELRRPASAPPAGSWETVVEARAQELAATGVPLEQIAEPILRMQVKVIRSLKAASQGRPDD